MLKKILLNILFSFIILASPLYPQYLPALNEKFNNTPQYPINNTDARLFYTYKHSSNSVQNPIAEGRAEELDEVIKKGEYLYLIFTAQFNFTGYNIENNTFERVVWKNIELNRRKRVFEIKTYDYKTQQEQYGNFDTPCSRLFLNMAGIIGMYRQLLFPTYASEKIEEEFLKQDWLNFSVEILFNTFETAYPFETPDPQYDDPGCALIVPYAIRIQNGDALGIYFFE
ncbi:MAG: hypothetical protein JSW63_04480 [Ignavibacterium sp.]|nr:MAG: hypothetical protein JSW63_04480 [Ignavibacterium sp.]